MHHIPRVVFDTVIQGPGDGNTNEKRTPLDSRQDQKRDLDKVEYPALECASKSAANQMDMELLNIAASVRSTKCLIYFSTPSILYVLVCPTSLVNLHLTI